MAKIFSFKGRAGRRQYFVQGIIDSLIIFVIILYVAVLTFIPYDNLFAGIIRLVCFVVFCFQLRASYATGIKRFHDFEFSGRRLWLLYIPIYNIYLFRLLHYREGTVGPNKYGPEPEAFKMNYPLFISLFIISLIGLYFLFVGFVQPQMAQMPPP